MSKDRLKELSPETLQARAEWALRNGRASLDRGDSYERRRFWWERAVALKATLYDRAEIVFSQEENK